MTLAGDAMKDFKAFWGLLTKLNLRALFLEESSNGFVHMFRYLFVGGFGFATTVTFLPFSLLRIG